MPKVKIPRKSTTIDMTAMCDVAFLLLSFFILATKQKPPEAITVQTPSSISTEVAKEKAILVTLNKEGRVFLMLGDKTKKDEILDEINTFKQLNLSPAEMTKLKAAEYIGTSFAQLKSALDNDIKADQMSGIPSDSTNNELKDWMRVVNNAYIGTKKSDFELLVKGDNLAKYPAFKNIIDAFQSNDLLRFKLVTNPEDLPHGSEYYINHVLNKTDEKE
ncbi:MAG: biopolymer transporter ExbD [Bacteroidetes bacterium]|nr:biopolymer transporter ExbD [Bacteroidota bacterium]